ncbi:TonB family protein [Reinekea sp.]|jgi:TonB family protein|uniref:TonB family protein n=1 Tax=Reinekea sp. TaxID=1970455 RepID=UPI0039892D5C
MYKFLLVVLSAVLLNVVHAQTYLNGVSAYEQLNKEYYLAALYTADPMHDAATILADKRPQKMVVRVTAKRWSPHKFNQLWRQDLALNNSFSDNLKLTEAAIAFTSFPKENLTVGDEIEISYTSKSGTQINLNGEAVLTYPDKGLFNAIVSTWIGDVPPSRLFQSDMLGNESIITSKKDLFIERFDNLSINPQRLDLVGTWQEAQQAAERALAKAEQELLEQQQKEADQKKQAAAEKKRLDDERKAAVALAAKRKKEAEEAKKKQQQNNSGNSEADKAKIAEEEAKLAAAVAAQQAAEARAAELEQQQAGKNQETLAREYAENLYKWEVQRDVYKRISYPEWARQFNQEGTIRIEFIINSAGQMVGITSLSPADSGLLGQELKDAVSRAAPFKAFPVELNSAQLKMVIEYEFSLEERVAELPVMPVPPAALEVDKELSLTQQAQAWQAYKQQIKSDISASIEYPFWAQDLKQQGVVKMEVTVNRQGVITNTKLTKKTRHAILNQELLDASDRIGGFSAFPQWINEQSVTVSIEHEFKL